MNLSRVISLLLLFILAFHAWGAGVYRWTDAQGNVHFGDAPPPERKAESYLQSRGVVFSEYDIETSRKGQADYRRLRGTGVPIILVGEQRMDGFNAATLTGWLEQAGHLRSAP